MKVILFIAFVICASGVASVPAPGAGYPGMPPEVAALIPPIARAFIPTPEEIAALNALKTTPAPGEGPTTPPTGPVAPPTMPAAVAHLVEKYKAAAQAAALAASALPPTPIV